MCGIIGYIGSSDAVPILLSGLKRLEYRGYDSAGIAVLEPTRIRIIRCVGKVGALEEMVMKDPPKGVTMGIGHVRWATHGRPSDENAHPHSDCSGRIALVHNGIIENHAELRRRLEASGHVFSSETDTEVLVHLIEEYRSLPLEEAVRMALLQVRGSYAIVVMSLEEPEKIVGARKGSPLLVGVGAGEGLFLASDVPAILDRTREIVFLDEEEIVSLGRSGDVRIIGLSGALKPLREPIHIPWDSLQAEKAGYKHFMLKEIHEQPKVVEDTMAGRISADGTEFFLDDVDLDWIGVKRIAIVACGTAFHAGLVGKFMIESFARIPVEVDYASEFRYRSPVLDENTVLLAISQSGETADTIGAVRAAKEMKVKVLSICNVLGSSLTRESDAVLYTRAGPEIGVASTKAFTAQLVVLLLLAMKLGRSKGILSEPMASSFSQMLRRIPSQMNGILEKERIIEEHAGKLRKKEDFLYLGRGINYPIALEGALKLKEISYIHAEGYPGGEMKHGPIALIDENLPVVAIALRGSVYEKMLSNIEEVKSRDGIVLSVANEGDEEVRRRSDYLIEIPYTDEIMSPLLSVVPLQLLAYHIAVRRGCDVDQPRNLAKSVTVE
jgi:glucosamine--fructose-6-phosphate aminotransferase (isomerizing)